MSVGASSVTATAAMRGRMNDDPILIRNTAVTADASLAARTALNGISECRQRPLPVDGSQQHDIGTELAEPFLDPASARQGAQA